MHFTPGHFFSLKKMFNFVFYNFHKQSNNKLLNYFIKSNNYFLSDITFITEKNISY